MKERVDLIIKKHDKILLLHRFKNGKEYRIIPGGGIENNETIQQAAFREAKEETNLNITTNEYLGNFEENYNLRHHHVFLITQFTGKLRLNSPEKDETNNNNIYIFEWHKIEKTDKLKLYPIEIKSFIYQLK